MKALCLEKNIAYDGTQLRSLFAYLDHGLMGDSVVSFRGACNVDFKHMVDGEDLLAQSAICGSDMVHFIVEKFEYSLLGAVGWQRLLAAIVKDVVVGHLTASGSLEMASQLTRDGDDIFFAKQKFSISIATKSPVSALIHFAVNVSQKGTPVSTCGLEDFKIEPRWFAQEVLSRFVTEVNTMEEAATKVRWVN